MSDLERQSIVRNIAVPAWMVFLFSSLGVVAAGTIGGTLVVDRSQVHANTVAIGTLAERIGRMEEKHKDILDALNGIRADIKELSGRMP